MVRRTVRGQQNLKSSSGIGMLRNYLEEYGSDNSISNTTVADLAKGFANAQRSIANNSSNDQTILELLEKVSKQLEKLQANQNEDENYIPYNQQNQQHNNNVQQSSQQQLQQQSKQGQEQSTSNQQTGRIDNVALQDLFGKVLLNSYNSSQKTSHQSSSNSSKNPTNNTNSNNETPALAVQTASQVLAKAQYELANELEASLQKLKQVISESEKIANQISNLLGESSSNKS